MVSPGARGGAISRAKYRAPKKSGGHPTTRGRRPQPTPTRSPRRQTNHPGPQYIPPEWFKARDVPKLTARALRGLTPWWSRDDDSPPVNEKARGGRFNSKAKLNPNQIETTRGLKQPGDNFDEPGRLPKLPSAVREGTSGDVRSGAGDLSRFGLSRAPAASDHEETLKEWSGLMLNSVTRILKPNGDILHKVEPMDRDVKEQTMADDLESGFVPEATKRLIRQGKSEAEKPLIIPDELSYSHLGGATAQTQKDRAEAMRDNALKGEGVDAITVEEIQNEIDPMSWAEYDALTPRQRAAVDYNGVLTDAILSDLKNQDSFDDLSPKKVEQYEQQVTKMFGKEGGSEIYAPRTIALLENLRLEDNLADLDDFLGLKIVVTDEDLEEAGQLTGALGPGTQLTTAAANIIEGGQLNRDQLVGQIVDKTANLEKEMAQAGEVLQTMRESINARLTPDVEAYGGEAPKFTDDLGFTEDIDEHFYMAYDFLNKSEEENGGTLQDLVTTGAEGGFPLDRLDDFLEYTKKRREHEVGIGGERLSEDEWAKRLAGVKY